MSGIRIRSGRPIPITRVLITEKKCEDENREVKDACYSAGFEDEARSMSLGTQRLQQ